MLAVFRIARRERKNQTEHAHFRALGFPVCFASRVMRPIVLVQLSGEIRCIELDSR
jgi:hypothetical protein